LVSFAPPETFAHRRDFLRLASRGRKFARPGFVMQALRGEGDAALRVGYTATKKIGNAVARNRARRRLKEAARLVLAGRDLAGLELVLICRRETADMNFDALRGHLESALGEVLR
jgi:ribonuclease P protein component